MNIPAFEEIIEPNDQTEARLEHLNELRELVGNVYPNKFERSSVSGDEDTITNLLNFAPIKEIVNELKENTTEGERPDKEMKENLNEKLKNLGNVRVAGRLAVPPRVMGKAAFVHLSDGKNRLQIYCRKEDFLFLKNDKSADSQDSLDAQNSWAAFGLLDHGDFVGVEGFLFLTNTGELSVHVEKIQFLTKAMLPMPDKMHGINDPEIRQRQRYADLIGSSLQVEHDGLTTREVFERRAKIISAMRRFLEDDGYIEVETPMLTPKATGAAAKPFETHHNALDIPLYARIAPELYLKRLVVGGFEKVYELNRNFRNEGISYKHNPEFTMLEFYCAYMDVNGMMDFCEEMIKESVRKATGGSLQIKYEDNEIDFNKFEIISMKEAIVKILNAEKNYLLLDDEKLTKEDLESSLTILKIHDFFTNQIPKLRKDFVEFVKSSQIKEGDFQGHIELGKDTNDKYFLDFLKHIKEIKYSYWEESNNNASEKQNSLSEMNGFIDKYIVEIFDIGIESELIQPTFIIDYPKSISPLSKASPENPQIAERFELFINGMECANGFSELNDPHEQYERFADQMKEREGGDEEAMILDEDYIRALSYGMPPAAGIGIGIDRIVMLLTNKHSIRDVILFPHLRPENKGASEEQEN